jgi:hypothetical protein
MSLEKKIQNLCDNTEMDNDEIAGVLDCSARTVRRYGGSFAKRMLVKREAKKIETSGVSRVALLADIHYPGVDWPSMYAVNEWLADYQPDTIVYMGDQLSLDVISTWNKNKPLLREGQRLAEDYAGFDEAILQEHERIVPKAKRVWLDGNHEERVNWYLQSNPEMMGFIEPHRVLKLEERGYEYLSYNKIYKLGKLNICHGFFYNIHHAAKTVNVFESSVAYAHVHTAQSFTKMSPLDSDNYHQATCIPCLSNTKPDYKANAPTRWINGFGIVEIINANRFFNLYTVIINKGTFIYNGKVYAGEM